MANGPRPARTVVKPLTPSLAWLNQMLSFFSSKEITIPSGFREQVMSIECYLENDVTGLINSLLDFAVESGNVDFSVETSNKNLTKTLDNWLQNINSSLRGKIPVGISGLAKEYYRERWKASSFLVLRTLWETVDGFTLPTKLWFVDGKDVLITDTDNPTRVIGSQGYKLRTGDSKSIPLPKLENEKIFVQKPYERWSSDYPTPFLIKRGVLYNAKFLSMLAEKGASVVGKAMEYLMILKKGDAELAKLNKPEFIYDSDDLKKVKDDLQTLLDEIRTFGGLPNYTTNFDTNIEHLIPQYEVALKEMLYAPIQKRILAGLGFIEVVEGVTSSRKDSVLNPKVFVSEVKSGVSDFGTLLNDILMTIIEENSKLHKKYANEELITIRTGPCKNFFNQDLKEFLRSLYDRGTLSKRTLTELGVDIDFDSEVERRKAEQEAGLDEKYPQATMYPPVVQNIPAAPGATSPGDKTPPDKKGPEAKNYKAQ